MMDFADRLDMMDDDCDIEGFPLVGDQPNDTPTNSDLRQAIDLIENIGLFSVDNSTMPYPQREERTILAVLRGCSRENEPCDVKSDGFNYSAPCFRYECAGCGNHFYSDKPGKFCKNCGRPIR